MVDVDVYYFFLYFYFFYFFCCDVLYMLLRDVMYVMLLYFFGLNSVVESLIIKVVGVMRGKSWLMYLLVFFCGRFFIEVRLVLSCRRLIFGVGTR